jgi:Leucine-rich repeat (LRR) protein
MTDHQDINKNAIIPKFYNNENSSKKTWDYRFRRSKYTNGEGHRVLTTGFGLINNIDSLKNLKLIDLEIWNDSSLTNATFNQISKLNNINELRIHLNAEGNEYIEGLGRLQNIKTIKIVHFTEEYITDLNQLQNLQELTLDLHLVIEFPPKGLDLSHLIKFNSFLGDIETITPEIQNMQHLKSIIFSKSKIKTIPIELSKLKNLETVMVGGTWSIDSLPDELALLEYLHTLNLFRNNLSHLPKGIINLKYLKNLNLDNNKLTQKQGDAIKVLLPKCKIVFNQNNNR